MKSSKLLAAGLTLSMGLAGCGIVDSEPKPTAPNGTYEQVVNNLGDKELGKLSVKQTVSFTAGNNERYIVYNTTPQPLDKARFEKTVNYFISLGDQAMGYSVSLNPNGKNNPLVTDAFVTHRDAKEHDFVLVSNDTQMPAIMGSDDPTASTAYLEQQSQTISVIRQPLDSQDQPAPFETNDGLYTETCQATEHVFTDVTTAADNVALALDTRLAQETVCNSFGQATKEAASGAAYSDYMQAAATDGDGYIWVGSSRFDLTHFDASQEQYAGMAPLAG